MVQLLAQIALHLLEPGGVPQVVFHKTGQVRAAAAEDYHFFGALRQNPPGIAPGVVGKDGGNDPHLLHIQGGHHVRSRLHRIYHRTGYHICTLVYDTGDGIAGYQQRFDALVLHKLKHITGHGHNLLLRVVPIGDMGAVPQIDQVLARQQPLHTPGHAKAPNAGIQNSNGAVLIQHRCYTSFSSLCPPIFGRTD